MLIYRDSRWHSVPLLSKPRYSIPLIRDVRRTTVVHSSFHPTVMTYLLVVDLHWSSTDVDLVTDRDVFILFDVFVTSVIHSVLPHSRTLSILMGGAVLP